MKWVCKQTLSLLSISLLSSISYASPSHTEVTVGGGYARANLNNLTLPVTTVETDTLHSSSSSSFMEMFGINQRFEFHSICPACTNRIDDVVLGVNLYNLSFTNTGSVYQFGDSTLNNLTYRLPINSTRLMIDGKLVLIPWHYVSPFILAGIGIAWNRLKYYDSPTVVGVSGINLASNQQLKFAFEAGLGLQASITQLTSVFVEYLYADMGNTRTSSYGNPNIAGAIEVPLHINSIVVGVNFSV